MRRWTKKVWFSLLAASDVIFSCKKVDLFSHDLILLPVHLGMHWCLAVIDFKSCQFLYYDSLLGSNSVCLARLRCVINMVQVIN